MACITTLAALILVVQGRLGASEAAVGAFGEEELLK
jgi:hypothetical protein